MNAILGKLPALVQEELDAANAKFPPFASMHEGYAVLLEEVEEAKDAFERMEGAAEGLWYMVRTDQVEDAFLDAASLEKHAIHAAAELIQVAAMARKFQAIGKEEKA